MRAMMDKPNNGHADAAAVPMRASVQGVFVHLEDQGMNTHANTNEHSAEIQGADPAPR